MSLRIYHISYILHVSLFLFYIYICIYIYTTNFTSLYVLYICIFIFLHVLLIKNPASNQIKPIKHFNYIFLFLFSFLYLFLIYYDICIIYIV